jgi:hypothetical protein
MKTIKYLCDAAYLNKENNGRRMSLPGFEKTHRYHGNGAFVFCISKQLPETKQVDGWMFHITVDPNYLEQAWELLHSQLLNTKTGSLAFALIDVDRTEGGAAKQIILYTFHDEEGLLFQSTKAMLHLLHKIERKLCSANIPAGETGIAAQKIPGSHYVSIRNALIPGTKRYISSTDALKRAPTQPFNPYNADNPYASFSMWPASREQFFHPAQEHSEDREALLTPGL